MKIFDGFNTNVNEVLQGREVVLELCSLRNSVVNCKTLGGVFETNFWSMVLGLIQAAFYDQILS